MIPIILLSAICIHVVHSSQLTASLGGVAAAIAEGDIKVAKCRILTITEGNPRRSEEDVDDIYRFVVGDMSQSISKLATLNKSVATANNECLHYFLTLFLADVCRNDWMQGRQWRLKHLDVFQNVLEKLLKLITEKREKCAIQEGDGLNWTVDIPNEEAQRLTKLIAWTQDKLKLVQGQRKYIREIPEGKRQLSPAKEQFPATMQVRLDSEDECDSGENSDSEDLPPPLKEE